MGGSTIKKLFREWMLQKLKACCSPCRNSREWSDQNGLSEQSSVGTTQSGVDDHRECERFLLKPITSRHRPHVMQGR